MALTSSITEYNPKWPECFEQEAQRLRPVFGDALVDLYHVGSTAIKGLSAKPEIDILAVVAKVKELEEWTSSLGSLGYKRGGDIQPGHHFLKRDIDEIRTHKLHICLNGHPQISRMLSFRNHIRNHDEDRLAYQDLKLKLEKENTDGIAQYLNSKAPFIDFILRKIQSEA